MKYKEWTTYLINDKVALSSNSKDRFTDFVEVFSRIEDCNDIKLTNISFNDIDHYKDFIDQCVKESQLS